MSDLGRPSLYKPEYCQMLIEHMKLGKSFETFGIQANATRPTLYRWLKEHEGFRDAKAMGELHSREFWESHGIDGLYATTETEKRGSAYTTNSKSMNAKIWELNMKRRFHDWNEDLFKPKDPDNIDNPDIEKVVQPQLNIIINGTKSS